MILCTTGRSFRHYFQIIIRIWSIFIRTERRIYHLISRKTEMCIRARGSHAPECVIHHPSGSCGRWYVTGDRTEDLPKEMLLEDIDSVCFNDNGATMMVLKVKDTSASASTMNALKQIKKLLKENCFIGGMSAILQDTKALVDQEMPWYIVCAAGCSLLVLFLSLKETAVPFLFMLGIVLRKKRETLQMKKKRWCVRFVIPFPLSQVVH